MRIEDLEEALRVLSKWVVEEAEDYSYRTHGTKWEFAEIAQQFLQAAKEEIKKNPRTFIGYETGEQAEIAVGSEKYLCGTVKGEGCIGCMAMINQFEGRQRLCYFSRQCCGNIFVPLTPAGETRLKTFLEKYMPEGEL